MTSRDINSVYFRLGKEFTPTHYSIDIHPKPRFDSFSGAIKITFTVSETQETPVTELILHALRLDITHENVSVALSKNEAEADGRVIACNQVSFYKESETALFSFEAPLPNTVGEEFTLEISHYIGHIFNTEECYGIYHSDKEDTFRLSTHFEPSSTRYAFPCYDDPSFSSTFQLSIVAPIGYSVISSTPVDKEDHVPASEYDREEEDSGLTMLPLSPLRRVVFEVTPKLHSCIIGFNMGLFRIMENYSKNDSILCRVVYPSSEPSNVGWFALDLLTKSFDFFEEFFNYKLPVTKVDLVALECFSCLGMENWGMINLKKEYMLVTESTPLERRQRITRLIGHEVCHHWFGDLVSIEWWDFLWLKEGMARYLEFFFTDSLFPSWGIWNLYFSNIFDTMLVMDADGDLTHPVEYCNSAPRMIENSFDTISYGKGAALLRMLFSLIDVTVLKKASHLLMKNFAHRSMKPLDLQQCIEDSLDPADPLIEEKKNQIEMVFELAKIPGHPYILLLPSSAGYTVHQFAMPGPHTILARYLHEQRRAQHTLDLMSPPQASESFEWDPKTLLKRPGVPFRTPIRVLEVKPQETIAPVKVETLSQYETEYNTTNFAMPALPGADFDHPQYTCYFNYGGTGVFRCDYDIETWKRIFELAPYLPDAERMCITATLFHMRTVNIGCFPSEKGERCILLLEWIMQMTQSPNTMNSVLWDYITLNLEKIVYIAQNYYCRGVIREFVASIYAPLIQRCALSFFVQEKAGIFNSQVHLPVQTVMNILNVLSLCGSDSIMDETHEICNWVFTGMFPQLSYNASATEPITNLSLERPNSTSHMETPPESMLNVNGAEKTLVNNSRDVSRAHLFRSARMDFSVPVNILTATIALEYKVETGDFECWCRIAAVVGKILHIQVDAYSDQIGAEFPTPTLDDRSRQEMLYMLNTLMPAFFSYENEKAFEFMGAALTCFNHLTRSVVKALLRNSRFLAYLLEKNIVNHRLVENIIERGAEFCGNGYIITLLKASLVNGSARQDILESYKTFSFMDEYIASAEAKIKNSFWKHTVKDTSGKAVKDHIAKALDEMETNCAWMDYCCTHFDRFLTTSRKKRVWFTRTSSSACLSASNYGDNLSENERDIGVSI